MLSYKFLCDVLLRMHGRFADVVSSFTQDSANFDCFSLVPPRLLVGKSKTTSIKIILRKNV